MKKITNHQPINHYILIFLKKYKTKSSPWFVPAQTLQSEILIGHNVVSKETLAVIDKVGLFSLWHQSYLSQQSYL